MLRRLTRCSSLCGESKLKAFCFQWRVPAAPREAGALRGGLAPRPLHSSPWVGLPGPHPGFLSFHDERNQRRAGAAPLDPLGGHYHPPNGARAVPPRKGLCLCPRPICHFEIAGESGLSSPRDWQRSHLLLSNRGAAVGRTEGQLEIGVTGEVHKQHRLHTHFLTPSLYTHYINIFYNKYCVLCADGSTNGVIMRFVGCTETAQNLHKLYRTPARCTTTPSPIPRIPLKVASKRATNPLVPRIESKKYLPAKTQGDDNTS